MAAVRKCICVIRLQLGPFAVHGSVELRKPVNSMLTGHKLK